MRILYAKPFCLLDFLSISLSLCLCLFHFVSHSHSAFSLIYCAFLLPSVENLSLRTNKRERRRRKKKGILNNFPKSLQKMFAKIIHIFDIFFTMLSLQNAQTNKENPKQIQHACLSVCLSVYTKNFLNSLSHPLINVPSLFSVINTGYFM